MKMRHYIRVTRDGSTRPGEAGDAKALGVSAILGAGGAAIPASLWGAALPAGLTGGILLAAYVGAAIYLCRREQKKYAPIAEEMASQEFQAALKHPALEGMLIAHRQRETGWKVRDLSGEIRQLTDAEWTQWKKAADATDVPLLTINAASINQKVKLKRPRRDNVVVLERSVNGQPMGCSPEDPFMRVVDPRSGEVLLNWAKRGGRDDTSTHHGLLTAETIEHFREAETRIVGKPTTQKGHREDPDAHFVPALG
jgi:hypothetical protein